MFLFKEGLCIAFYGRLTWTEIHFNIFEHLITVLIHTQLCIYKYIDRYTDAQTCICKLIYVSWVYMCVGPCWKITDFCNFPEDQSKNITCLFPCFFLNIIYNIITKQRVQKLSMPIAWKSMTKYTGTVTGSLFNMFQNVSTVILTQSSSSNEVFGFSRFSCNNFHFLNWATARTLFWSL